jgi:histidinol-phosphate/aromatic aminotransferase/cobyric acid decarboxylase-like protein
LKDCLRVTVGTPNENEQFMIALKESIRETE